MRIGIASDRGGFELKENLAVQLRDAGHEAVEDHFSARHGVEDDHMNILCLGGRTLGSALAWDLVQAFLAAEFSQAQRHLRRLRKVDALEDQPA